MIVLLIVPPDSPLLADGPCGGRPDALMRLRDIVESESCGEGGMRRVRWRIVFVGADSTEELGPDADDEKDACRMRDRLNEIEAEIGFRDGRYEVRNEGGR